MKLKDRLLIATKKAADYYSSGTDPDSAVIKVAKENNFNIDQTDRLTEMFNTALTLHHFKTAADRTSEFDLADKGRVAQGLYAEDEKPCKKASHDYSFYDTREFNYKKASSVPECKAEEVHDFGFSLDGLARQAMRYVRMNKQAAQLASDTEEQIRSHMITELYKLADSIIHKNDPEDAYQRLKHASHSPRIFKNIDKVLPDRFSKLHEKYAEDDIIDMSDLENEEITVDKLKELMKNVDEFHMSSISFSKKAEDFNRRYVELFESDNDFFGDMLKKAQSGGGNGANSLKSAIGAGKNIVDDVNAVASWLNTPASGVLHGLPRIAPTEEEVVDILQWKHQQEDDEVRDAKQNAVRSAILQELIMTDPIIQEADPNDVAAAYETMIQTAPRASLNKAVVTSVLRNAINSTAFGPYEAKTLSDFDRSITQRKAVANV